MNAFYDDERETADDKAKKSICLLRRTRAKRQQWRFLHERSAQIQNRADIIRRHRDEHAVDWLTGACQEANTTGDVQAVLNRFLRLDH